MTDKLLGVVLAGGRSTRMGRNKADLPHPDGGTFLAHAIDRLARVTDSVVVSAAGPVNDLPTVLDPEAHCGPAMGIAASLRYASRHGFAACLVSPVDTPHLAVDDLTQLVDRWRATGSIVLAQSDRIEPLIAIYPTRFVDEIESLARSNRRSLSRHFRSQPDATYETVGLSTRHCRNVNSPEDL